MNSTEGSAQASGQECGHPGSTTSWLQELGQGFHQTLLRSYL